MNRHPFRLASVVLAVLFAASTPSPTSAQTPAPVVPESQSPSAQAQTLPAPQIVIADVTEDKQHLVRATVTLSGAPLVGARVNFGVARTFGILDLGIDTTLDDGTAAVPFPERLPGDAAGTFEAVASIAPAQQYAGASARARLSGAGIVVATAEPFPHALWSSKPLWPLVMVIVVLLTGVWSVYVFVVAQLVKIRREGSSQ